MKLIKIIGISSILNSIFFFSPSFGQNVKVDLSYSTHSITKANLQIEKIVSVSNCLGDLSSRSLPYYTNRINFPNPDFSDIEISNLVFEEIEIEPMLLTKLTNKLDIQKQIVFEKKKAFLQVSFVPLIKESEGSTKVLKLVHYEYRYTSNPNSFKKLGNNRSYTNTSVLASGDWYKMAVTTDGIYKIGIQELNSLGINTNGLNPQNVRIFGYGGIVPEDNSKPRYDDLPEVATAFSGTNLTSFGNSDYIYFFAKGPNQWNFNANNKVFNFEKNSYSDTAFYFITIGTEIGKKIIQQNSQDNFTNVMTAFQDYQIHKQDRITAVSTDVKSGRILFGEQFDFVSDYTFEFNFPNIKQDSNIQIKSHILSHSTSNASFSLSLGGQKIMDQFTSGIAFEYDLPYGDVNEKSVFVKYNADKLPISIVYNKPNSSSVGFLNFIQVNAFRSLNFTGGQMAFRNYFLAGNNAVTQINLGQVDDNTLLWDISNPTEAIQLNYSVQGTNAVFNLSQNEGKELIAFNQKEPKTPILIGKIANQNLHGLETADLIIISPSEYFSEALRLAKYRMDNQKLKVLVIEPQEIYNEFGSGKTDAAAIRDFMKMFYDRAGNDLNKIPKNLLLFGDGSYDNRNKTNQNSNTLVTFQSRNSWSNTGSYVMDDFFVLLDENEGALDYEPTSSGNLDIGVGRIPVKNISEAREMVDKIIRYDSNKSFGDWRNMLSFVADDEDSNLHLNDAELLYGTVTRQTKKFDFNKIYFDAYQQVSTPGGSRYPEVNRAINEQMNSGCLILNYTGHGGEVGWAHERVLGIADINTWKNDYSMPLLFTATCSFSRWDDPYRVSAGELAALVPNGGPIALFTTTRTVYASGNFSLNNNFLNSVFDSSQGPYQSLGELFRKAKNKVGLGKVNPNDIDNGYINSRNFSLLGDPSIVFAFPKMDIKTDSIKSLEGLDTLKAGAKVKIYGKVVSQQGQLISDFNGVIYPSIFDKPDTLKTLGQDKSSLVQKFISQKNIIYKGKATVKNGFFEFEFIVPKDISYLADSGRISYYANTETIDANGYDNGVIIGGSLSQINTDKVGPEITAFLNSEKFVSGGTVNNLPVLKIQLKDISGINTVGKGIGHDITGTLIDPKGNAKIISLNQYFQSKLDNYQEGEVSYPMNKMEAGNYQLKIKAWDVFNNSNENKIDFSVKEYEKLGIENVFNYPNPFTTATNFQFEHNKPGEELNIQVKIFTASGTLVKTILRNESSNGTRINDIFWDGKDNFNDKLARGVYVYQIKVKSQNSEKASKFEKLVIL